MLTMLSLRLPTALDMGIMSKSYYVTMVFVSCVTVFFASSMALIKYTTRNKFKYMLLGIGLLGSAIYNIISIVLNNVQSSYSAKAFLDIHFDQGIVLADFFIASFLVASFILSFYRRLTGRKSLPAGTVEYIGLLAVIGINFVVQISIPFIPIIALNFVTLTLFIIAFIGYLNKWLWRYKFFEYWLLLAILLFIASQIALIAANIQIMDGYFQLSLIFKLIGYIFIATGLLMSMHIAYSEVESARDKIDAILKSIGEGVFVTDIAGKIVTMNSKAEELSGVPFSVAQGKQYNTIFKLINDNHDVSKPYPDYVAEVFNKRQTVEITKNSLLIRNDELETPVTLISSQITDRYKRMLGCVTVLRDITKERELEQSKDNFISIAAHQLRTPLGAMRWSLEMLLSGDLGKISEKIKERMDQIYENNLRMINLVKDLLDVSRIDQRRVADNPQPTDLGQIIKSVINEMSALAFKNKITITTEPEHLTTKPVNLDPDRFHEVVQNLTSNAIKYNKREGTIRVRLVENPLEFLITIEDNGVGIPKEDFHKLFSKFYRASNARINATEGSGLGLFVVKSYVEGWGGRISFASELDQGSAFTISIPKSPKQHSLDKNLAEKPHAP